MGEFWIIAGIAWLLLLGLVSYCLWQAPTGYEDERGFHEGEEPESDGEEENRDVA